MIRFYLFTFVLANILLVVQGTIVSPLIGYIGAELNFSFQPNIDFLHLLSLFALLSLGRPLSVTVTLLLGFLVEMYVPGNAGFYPLLYFTVFVIMTFLTQKMMIDRRSIVVPLISSPIYLSIYCLLSMTNSNVSTIFDQAIKGSLFFIFLNILAYPILYRLFLLIMKFSLDPRTPFTMEKY